MGNPYAPPGAKPPRQTTDEADDAYTAAPDREPDSAVSANSMPAEPDPQTGARPAPPAATPAPPASTSPKAPTPGAPGHVPHIAPIDPAIAGRASRRIVWFGLAMLGLLVTMALPFPGRLLGIVAAVVTLVLGARALMGLVRTRTRGLILPALALGLGLTAVYLLQLSLQAATWGVTATYESCVDRAITVTATDGCKATYRDSIERDVGEVLPQAPFNG